MTYWIGLAFFAFAAAVAIGTIALTWLLVWDWFHRHSISEPEARLSLYEPARNVSHFSSERVR